MCLNITNLVLTLCCCFCCFLFLIPAFIRVWFAVPSTVHRIANLRLMEVPLSWSAVHTEHTQALSRMDRCSYPESFCGAFRTPLTSQIESYRINVLEKIANRSAEASAFYNVCASFHEQPERVQVTQLLASRSGKLVMEILKSIQTDRDVESAIYNLTNIGLPVYFRYGYPDIGTQRTAVLELAELPSDSRAARMISKALGYVSASPLDSTLFANLLTHSSHTLQLVDLSEVQQFVTLANFGANPHLLYTHPDILAEYRHRLHVIPTTQWRNYLGYAAARWLAFRFHIGADRSWCTAQYQHLHPLHLCRALKPKYLIAEERINAVFHDLKETYLSFVGGDPFQLGASTTRAIRNKLEQVHFIHSKCWMSAYRETEALLTSLENELLSKTTKVPYLDLVQWIWESPMRRFRSAYSNRLYKDLVATFIEWNGAYDSNSNTIVMTPGFYHFLAHKMRDPCELTSILSYQLGHEMTHIIQRVAKQRLPYLRARSYYETVYGAADIEASADWHGIYVAHMSITRHTNNTHISRCFFDTCLQTWCGNKPAVGLHPSHLMRFQIIVRSVREAYTRTFCGL